MLMMILLSSSFSCKISLLDIVWFGLLLLAG